MVCLKALLDFPTVLIILVEDMLLSTKLPLLTVARCHYVNTECVVYS